MTPWKRSVLQIALFCFLTPSLAQEVPSVILNNGRVVGKIEKSFSGKKYESFQGIPYAKPPVGPLRFKDPVPADKWMGTIVADSPGLECIQYNHLYIKSKFNPFGSEDCLYINVFRPAGHNQSKELLDVIVYIHGGAFMFLSSQVFGPQFLMDKNLVFVNLNYRLGIFGFLSTNDKSAPGNFGLKDQQLALKWVQENIEAFGGNPKAVTLAGVSAGGVSAHYHILSQKSKGLFQKAISVSGSAFVPWAVSDSAKERSLVLGDKLGCPTETLDMMMECLRTRPAKKIVQLTSMFLPWLYIPFTPFGPVIEPKSSNAFIDEAPIKIIKEKKFSDVPWLISFAAQEGLYPGAEIICKEENFAKYKQDLDTLLPHVLDFDDTAPTNRKGEIIQKIRREYLSNNTVNLNNTIDLIGDRTYLAGIVEAALEQGKEMSSQIYAYRFSYRGSGSGTNLFCKSSENYGVSHGDDSGYILSNSLNVPSSQEDIKMIHKMVNVWYSFVKSGKPEYSPITDWPPLRSSLPSFTFVDILSPTKAIIGTSSSVGRVDFWKSLGLAENEIS